MNEEAPTTVWLELKCGHGDMLHQSVPRIGQSHLCRICQSPSIIIEINGVWAWKCKQCRAGRTYGVIRYQADCPATSHAQSRGHTVVLWRRGFPETISIIKPENDVEPLPF